MFLLKKNVSIPDMRKSKTLDEQSMNAAQKSLPTVFSIANCRQYVAMHARINFDFKHISQVDKWFSFHAAADVIWNNKNRYSYYQTQNTLTNMKTGVEQCTTLSCIVSSNPLIK